MIVLLLSFFLENEGKDGWQSWIERGWNLKRFLSSPCFLHTEDLSNRLVSLQTNSDMLPTLSLSLSLSIAMLPTKGTVLCVCARSRCVTCESNLRFQPHWFQHGSLKVLKCFEHIFYDFCTLQTTARCQHLSCGSTRLFLSALNLPAGETNVSNLMPHLNSIPTAKMHLMFYSKIWCDLRPCSIVSTGSASSIGWRCSKNV